MPPKKAKSRPVLWKVIGGSLSGGLIARQGPETKSAEHAERLATGAVVQELEVQGERMRYKRVSGAGPDTGWISTKFKGKDQLEKRGLKAWILVTGTRGDIQPYVALALGMKEAGYDMTIWTCEDYRGFVEGYGIRMRKIAGSTEAFVKRTSINSTSQDKDGKSASKEASDVVKMLTTWSDFNAVKARWSISLEFGVPIGGINAQELLPPDVERQFAKEVPIGHYRGTLPWLRPEIAEKYRRRAEELEAELEEENAARAAAEAASPPSSKAEPEPQQPPGLDWAGLSRQAKAAPGSALACVMEEASGEDSWVATGVVKGYVDFKEFFSKNCLDQYAAMVVAGLDGIFMFDALTDASVVDAFAAEARRDPPDIVMYNNFWSVFGLALEASCGIPSLVLSLQPAGIFFGDPHAQWLSDQQYPAIRDMNPELAKYPTLAEARKHYKPSEEWFDYISWAHKVVFEELITEPHLGVHPIRDMGPRAFFRRSMERHMVGFLSSIASDRFMKFMGDFSTKLVAKHHYTGFWTMDERLQTGKGSADMFGGPELMKKIEDFVAAGDPPVYIGWGSCVSQARGKEWMVMLAVTALKNANLRGIVHEGWADLSMELLETVLDGDDGLGLMEYARKNILFVAKAPQAWLFPKCSAIVIHGGVGTLAAAWASGVPVIVCPVWHDQFGNAWLNVLMGAGIYCQPIDMVGVTELANTLKLAISDPQIKRGAQAVQFSMMMDKGIEAATEHINDVLLEEVPSGRWKQRWL